MTEALIHRRNTRMSADTNVSDDTEITLTHDDLTLVVSPYGASLRGLSREVDGEPHPIVTGYSGAKNKVGGQGDVLIPFPGRVREGRYTFEGQEHQMVKNDSEAPNAIHGFLRKIVWDTLDRSESAVTFSTTFDSRAHEGYPFALRAQVTYRVTAQGMHCAFDIENLSAGDAPVAAGFHPYFTVGSDLIDLDTLHVPFQSTLEYNENLVPTGTVLPVEGTSFDFRHPHPIGDTVFNTCFLNPLRDTDGLLRISLSDPATGRAVTVALDRAFDYVVLYSGDPLPDTHRRRALAIEPMTCGSDAFNHPEWGLVSLGPDESLSGSWEVTAE
jgi:aldose 1-epimerase